MNADHAEEKKLLAFVERYHPHATRTISALSGSSSWSEIHNAVIRDDIAFFWAQFIIKSPKHVETCVHAREDLTHALQEEMLLALTRAVAKHPHMASRLRALPFAQSSFFSLSKEESVMLAQGVAKDPAEAFDLCKYYWGRLSEQERLILVQAIAKNPRVACDMLPSSLITAEHRLILARSVAKDPLLAQQHISSGLLLRTLHSKEYSSLLTRLAKARARKAA